MNKILIKKFHIGLLIAISVSALSVIIIMERSFENEVNTLNTTDTRPNIIVILTDDVSVAMIDILLTNNMMPNLQEHVIDKGTIFTNSFVSSPLCCPSRATTFTGLYPHNHGILFNKPIFENDTQVVKGGFNDFNDSSTIATWLKNGGYKTGFFGKYMNGYYGQITYIPPGWDDWKAFAGNKEVMYDFEVNNNGKIIKINNEYKTDYLSKSAVDFIKNSDSPFFLFISTFVAHATNDGAECAINDNAKYKKSILVSPKYNGTLKNINLNFKPSFNEKDVSDKNPRYREIPLITNIDCIESQFKERTESVRSVDDVIGSIHNALVTNDQLDNTIIIFTSDNGYSFGEHRLFDKIIPYDESIRVPLFIKIPEIGNQTVNHLVINNDLVPTILELANLKSDVGIDGLSLLPIMENSSKNLRESFLIEIYTGSGNFYHGIRSFDSLYVEWTGIFNFTEYYDLEKDPFQQFNRAECIEKHCIEKSDKLKQRLYELKKCGNGTC